MKSLELGQYVVVDPKICHGQLTFKGTRVMVGQVLAGLTQGMSREEILRNWPSIPWEAVQEAQMLAVHRLIHDFPGNPQPWWGEVTQRVVEEMRDLRKVEEHGVHNSSSPGIRDV